MEQQYSLKSPAVKRLMREARELREPTHQYCAQPLEDNLFEWHFTVAGAADSAFDGGRYHGRIILPSEYPMKPPHIIVLTPNGRFVVGHKICLSVSGYHPETWQPSWSIRTVLLALIGFMPTKGEGAIGALDYTDKERKHLAKQSVKYVCPTCDVKAGDALPERPAGAAAEPETSDMPQISFAGKPAANSSTKASSANAGGAASSGTALTATASDSTVATEETDDASHTSSSSASADKDTCSSASESRSETPSGTRQRKSSKSRRAPTTAGAAAVPAAVQENSKYDIVWTMLLWLIVAALVFLLVRRLFWL